jgi:siderophore synthetase component
MEAIGDTADALAAAPLLNCVLRELAEPVGDPRDGRSVHRLRAGGRLLRVRDGHRPAEPQLWTHGAWHPLGHAELVKLVAEEMRGLTGRTNDTLPIEMIDSRDAVAAILVARARATPPGDPWLRSEQALVMGHLYHPAPKARGGGPSAGWLRYAPEVHARFPLTLLGVREDAMAEEGDTRALDTLGTAPPGYRVLPAHPWQLELTRHLAEVREAFVEGRLVRIGQTAGPASPTASVRTVHLPSTPGATPGATSGGEDLFLKFSLDVRITNDVRRLWRHDLLRARRTDAAVVDAFAEVGHSAAWLSDRGHRTVDGLFEIFPVLLRDGLRRHLPPGTTALLTAALAEGFDGSPLDRLTDPLPWWTTYLRHVVPPVLEAFARHGIVLECHLQNTLIAVDAHGMPVRAVFRDVEGVKLVPEVTREAGWERLVYCLVVNHLTEIAGALAHRFPEAAGKLWPAARREFQRYDDERGLAEIAPLLAAPTVPGKANLLLRWTGADGADSRYLPLANPLRLSPPR